MDLINEYNDELDACVLVANASVANASVSTCVLVTDTDDILTPEDPLAFSCEVSVPEFPQKININHDEELPSLEELTEDAVVEAAVVEDAAESLEQIMNSIESTVNFNSFDDSMYALNNPEFLMNRIQGAFDVFKEKVGRQMTYSEMRYMMG
jgi:hypothetical protein